LAFTIGGDPPSIRWEREPVQKHADDVLADAQTPGTQPEARRAAEEWLTELLKDGPVASGDLHDPEPGTIRQLAKEADFAWRTVRRAADRMGVRRERDLFTKAFTWRLPRSGKPVVQPCCPPLSKGEQHGQHGPQEESIGPTEGNANYRIHVVHQDSARTTSDEQRSDPKYVHDDSDRMEREAIQEPGM
jgi:hypothetical protein